MSGTGRVLIVKNVTREGPGLLALLLDHHGIGYDIVDLDKGETFPDPTNYAALVVLGGPDSANDQTPKMTAELPAVRKAVDAGMPYLGICLGLQVLVRAMGGKVVKNRVAEIGFIDPDGQPFEVELTSDGQGDALFAGLSAALRVFHLHGETVELARGMTLLGTGRHCRNQVVRVGPRAYGLQCHFEFTAELLRACAREDPDLQPIGAETLLGQFDAFQAEYTRIGNQLLTNFLKLAGLI
jgi:GMP synthase-like glutamine amidotransferase